MNNKIHQAFTSLGLSDKENRLMQALFKQGQSTAYRLAQIAGLKPPTAYAVLDGLVSQGLVLKIPIASGHEFRPRSVDELLDASRSRHQDMVDSVPLLRAMTSAQSDSITIHSYQGIDEIKTALEYQIDSLHNAEYQALYCLMHQGNKQLLEIQKNIDRTLQKQNMSLRAIAPDHTSLSVFKTIDQSNPNSQVRWIDPGVYAPEYSIEIMPTFVRLVMPKQLQVIIMDGVEVADSFRAMFELSWSGARDYDA